MDLALAIILIPAFVLVGFARIMGNGPYVALNTSLYVGYALFSAFPFLNYLPTAPALTALGAQVALYLAFTVVAYLVLRRVAASDFVHIGTVGIILVALAATGFLIALFYHVFPTHAVYSFSPAIDTLFAAKQLFYAWFAAPLVALFIFSR